MIAVLLVAATIGGAVGGALVYAMGYGILGMMIGYAITAYITSAAVIAWASEGQPKMEQDFQQQVERDLLNLKKEMLQGAASVRRVDVFRRRQPGERRSEKASRPIMPKAV